MQRLECLNANLRPVEAEAEPQVVRPMQKARKVGAKSLSLHIGLPACPTYALLS